ncbi:UvrD-helicase domain-containing protein [Sinomonas flava]|uniref:DNA helicase n=1 Tax=Sinomonas flava TaxID=496857 RepID=A0ABN3BSS0_9MICC
MTDVVLDDSQLAAVEVEPSARQIVIAGPGSGKTEVVSHLIERLIDVEGVDPVDGIMVISFSNAAVFAADARLRANDTGPAAVQTMDSLASEIIGDLADDDPSDFGFDKRVQMATRLLSNHGWDRLEGLKHLVVDEVQDVVGVRADFLLALTRSLCEDAGFSMLGDPAQGIYDWQLRVDMKPLSLTTSLDLLAKLQRLGDVEVKHLTGQYRALSRDAKRVIELRDSVLGPDSGSMIEEFFAGVVAGSTVTDLASNAAKWRGTTVFLTANNGQALLTAGSLADAGLGVEVRRSAQQRVLAGWIARLLADSPTAGITRDEIEERANQGILHPHTPAEIWRALRSVTGGQGREVNIPNLARGLLRARPLLPDLIEPIQSPFIVSTVHRAKGLEFDNVVYVDFPDKPRLDGIDDALDDGEAARRLFVALSRARRLLIRADGPDDRQLRSIAPHGGTPRRWYLGGFKKWMTFGFELRVDDLDRASPPGLDPAATQQHIASNLKPGDPLQIDLNLDKSTLRLPVWDLVHQNHVVGTTSEAFGESVVSRIGTREGKSSGWPRLNGARVESIATISGPPQQGTAGRRGLWLAPVCAGMLRFEWNGESDV